MKIVHPRPQEEMLVVEAVNFIIFSMSVFTFGACWRAIAKWQMDHSESSQTVAEIYPKGWTIFGYTLFVSAALWYVGAVVPDLLVANIVFVAIAMLLRLDDGSIHSVATYAGWGALLALGYYAKVVLFYFGILLIVGLAVKHFRKRSLALPAASLITFLALISPFAFFLSRTVGHVTIGDAGRLNYAWLADVPETKTWLTGEPNAATLPYYPGPLMHTAPMVFKLPILSGVTYAARFDPSRYDLSNRPHFSLRPQLKRIASNLQAFRVVLGAEDSLLVVLVILALYSPREFLMRLAGTWFYSVPAIIIISMYVLVFLVWRYVLAFSPLLWGTALAAVSVPIIWRNTVRPIILAGLIVFACCTGPGLLHFLAQQDSSGKREMAVAQSVSDYGIGQGEHVAIIGEGQNAWWAHLAGVSITSEIWPSNVSQFWASSPSEQKEILQIMISTGAKAVVWRQDIQRNCPSPWHALPDSAGCIFIPETGY